MIARVILVAQWASPYGFWCMPVGWGRAKRICFAAIQSCAREDLANAWAYYRSHKNEIDQHVRDNEEA